MLKRLASILFPGLLLGCSPAIVEQSGSNQTRDSILYVGVVLNDTTTLINTQSGYRDPILLSTHPIEIRFAYYPVRFSNPGQVVVFYDTCWNVRYPAMNVHDSIAGKTRPMDRSMDSVFQLLVKHHIFSLPDMDETQWDSTGLNLNTSGFESKGAFILEAVCYRVSYKVGNRFRAYLFWSPDFYSSLAPLETVYSDYKAIRRIFYQLISS